MGIATLGALAEVTSSRFWLSENETGRFLGEPPGATGLELGVRETGLGEARVSPRPPVFVGWPIGYWRGLL